MNSKIDLQLKLILLFTVLSIFLFASLAHSLNGQELLEYCNLAEKVDDRVVRVDEDILAKASYCYGFIRGVAGANDAFSLIPSIKAVKHCAPENVTNGQLSRVVLKFLRQHPENLHSTGAALVLAALRNAYPCESQP